MGAVVSSRCHCTRRIESSTNTMNMKMITCTALLIVAVALALPSTNPDTMVPEVELRGQSEHATKAAPVVISAEVHKAYDGEKNVELAHSAHNHDKAHGVTEAETGDMVATVNTDAAEVHVDEVKEQVGEDKEAAELNKAVAKAALAADVETIHEMSIQFCKISDTDNTLAAIFKGQIAKKFTFALQVEDKDEFKKWKKANFEGMNYCQEVKVYDDEQQAEIREEDKKEAAQVAKAKKEAARVEVLSNQMTKKLNCMLNPNCHD